MRLDFLCWLVSGSLTLLPQVAFAQDAERSDIAIDVGHAALTHFRRGEWEVAYEKFELAERLAHSPVFLLFMARCRSKTGHLVEAREHYLKVSREALSASAPRPFRDARKSAAKELAELESRLPYVSVVVQGSGGAVQVTLDNSPVPRSSLGVPQQVNPGQHILKVVENGIESPPITIVIKEGARETIVLTIRSTGGASMSHARHTNTSRALDADGSLASESLSDSAAPAKGTNSLRLASYISLGVGLVAGGMGTYWLVQSSSTSEKADQAYKACTALRDRACSASEMQEITNLDDTAKNEHDLAVGAFITGGAGLVVSGTLFLIDHLNQRSTHSAHFRKWQPIIGYRFAGVSGTF